MLLQVIQQELVHLQRKCREQDASERRMFEKMLGVSDKQNSTATSVHSAPVITTAFFLKMPFSVSL